jgi:hypothetical protein
MHYTMTGAQNKKTMPEKCERQGLWTKAMKTFRPARHCSPVIDRCAP